MTDITEVKGIGPATAVKLHGAGIRSAEALANSQVDHLVGIIGRSTARKIIKNAQDLLGGLEGVVTTPDTPEVVEKETKAPEGDLTAVSGIGPKTQTDLIAAGYTSPESLAEASVADLSKVEGVGKKTAEKIIENAQALFKEAEEVVDEIIEQELEAELEEVEEIEEAEEIQTIEEDLSEDGVRTEHARSPTAQGIPTRKKRGVQISSEYEKIDLDALDDDVVEQKSGWKVKAKELTDEEREARRLRQEMLRASEKITRAIPTPPEPVKAVKSGTKSKAEKPVKKTKSVKSVQQQVKKTKAEKKAERFVDYFSNADLHPIEKPMRPKVKGNASGTVKPRIELDRDTYLGKITSKRRSRRNINNRQLVVDLTDEFEPDMLVGQKVYFTYPDGKKLSGSISRRFGKKSTGKVLVAFKKGVREEAIFQKIYKY